MHSMHTEATFEAGDIRAAHLPALTMDAVPPPASALLALLPSSALNAVVRPVGRLDADSEGLLLFTNDGTLAKLILDPQSRCEKSYVALVAPRAPLPKSSPCLEDFVTRHVAPQVTSGMALPGGGTGRAERCRLISTRDEAVGLGCGAFDGLLAAAQLEDTGAHASAESLPSPPSGRGAGVPPGGLDATCLVEVVMTQGAKREVRRLLKAAGLRTIRLCRTAVAGVALSSLTSLVASGTAAPGTSPAHTDEASFVDGFGYGYGLRSGEAAGLEEERVAALWESCAATTATASGAGLPTYRADLGRWVEAREMAEAGCHDP